MEVRCSACGHSPLGPPQEEIHDPDGAGPENEDGHIKITYGSKGPRFLCRETGNITSIKNEEDETILTASELVGDAPQPDSDESANGGGTGDDSAKSSRNETQEKPSPGDVPEAKPRDGVYDFDEEQDSIDILIGTVENPTYGLTDDQVDEVRDWADIYDGQLSPNMLEDILKNMSGVQKQMAELIAQKYEAKMSKWTREQSQGSRGPPIGVDAPVPKGSPSPKRRGGGGGGNPTPSPDKGGSPDKNKPSPDTPDKKPPSKPTGKSKKDMSPSELRKMNRIERRSEAIESAMDEAAETMAQNVAGEAGQGFFRARDLFFTLLEKKAERDPEKFFEVMEKFDVDLFEFLLDESGEGSDSSGGRGRSQSQTDAEIDDAISELTEGGGTGNKQQETTPNQNTNNDTGGNEVLSSDGEENLSEDFFDDIDEEESIEEDYDPDEEEEFNEMFGD